MAQGYQFGHIQSFNSKGNKRNRSYTDVLLENSRVAGNAPHVEDPEPPNLIWGKDPIQLVPLIASRIADAKRLLRKSGSTKRIQINTHVLEGGVFSYPLSTKQLKIASDEERKEYLEWRKATALFAIYDARERGLEPLSVVEHLDEPFPHIHVLSVPVLNESNLRLDAKMCNPGHIAKLAVLADEPKAVVKANRAYIDAMSIWQDKLYDKVSVVHGQTRIGPARRRLGTAEWKAEKHSQKVIARSNKSMSNETDYQNKRLNEKLDEVQQIDNEIIAKASALQDLVDDNDELTNDNEALQNDNSSLRKENDSLKQLVSDLNIKHEQDIKSMSESANKEIRRLQDEIDQYRPRPRR